MARYYRLEEARNAPIKSVKPFIFANERLTRTGRAGRYYTVLESFAQFLQDREKYPHAHEILVDHVSAQPDTGGRPVFDFDVKGWVPSDFKDQVEDTLLEVFERYIPNFDGRIEFVWSTSQNPSKFSKHLTLRNIYLEPWLQLLRIIYQLFSWTWDEKYFWIHSEKLFDRQIVRQNASLRMVGSRKLDGHPLVLDDPHYKFKDSLIRIYLVQDFQGVHRIRLDDFSPKILGDLQEYWDEPDKQDASSKIKKTDINLPAGPTGEKYSYPSEIYRRAFQLFCRIDPSTFRMGKIKGSLVTLIRLRPRCCLLSGRLHESENAFLIIRIVQGCYSVRFGCYRFCSHKKSAYLGSFGLGGLVIMHPKWTSRAFRAFQASRALCDMKK